MCLTLIIRCQVDTVYCQTIHLWLAVIKPDTDTTDNLTHMCTIVAIFACFDTWVTIIHPHVASLSSSTFIVMALIRLTCLLPLVSVVVWNQRMQEIFLQKWRQLWNWRCAVAAYLHGCLGPGHFKRRLRISCWCLLLNISSLVRKCWIC